MIAKKRKIVNGDHPRVCGEKSFIFLKLLRQPGSPPRVRGEVFADRSMNPNEGSPPRVRGEVEKCRVDIFSKGITPACAGRSTAATCSGRVARDHPRVCGEKALREIQVIRSVGSPPRVRGEAICKRSLYLILRITPACAGRRT